MVYDFKKYFSVVFFLLSVFISGFIANWLVSVSETEEIYKFYKEYSRLTLRKDFDGASSLHEDILNGQGSKPLSLNWLTVVKTFRDNKKKLYFYVQILEGHPNRENTYREIAELLKKIKVLDTVEAKNYYVKLQKIDGIRKDLLLKYQLTDIKNPAQSGI